MENNTIRVFSSVDDDNYQPIVVQTLEGKTIAMSAETAQQKAIALTLAVAYSDAESAIFQIMSQMSSSKKFGKKEASEKELQMAGEFVRLLRSNRQAFPFGIETMFGYHSHQPLVVVASGDEKIQLELDMALSYAKALIEAAEAAQTDSFLYRFGTNELGLKKEEIEALLQEFMEYRKNITNTDES